jgi:hypothetical protein
MVYYSKLGSVNSLSLRQIGCISLAIPGSTLTYSCGNCSTFALRPLAMISHMNITSAAICSTHAINWNVPHPSAFRAAPPPVTYADPQGTCVARTTYLFAPGQLHLLTYIEPDRGVIHILSTPQQTSFCQYSGYAHGKLENLLAIVGFQKSFTRKFQQEYLFLKFFVND